MTTNDTTSPYLGCMLAHEYEAKRVKFPVAVEDKLDGLRITFVDGKGYTRNAKTYETFGPHAAVFKAMAGLISAPHVHFDTEMMARNWNETSKLLKRTKDINYQRIVDEVTCYLFDVYAPEIADEPYQRRRELVEIVAEKANTNGFGVKFALPHTTIVNSQEELDAAFTAALLRGSEGVMVKPLDGLYTLKRSYAWLKIKPWKDITVTIVGGEHGWGQCPICMSLNARSARAAIANESLNADVVDADDVPPIPDCPKCKGEGEVERSDMLGAFLCKTEDGEDMKCGMGFTHAQQREFMTDLPSLIGKKIDVKVQLDASGGNQIVARHPVFMRFREDV